MAEQLTCAAVPVWSVAETDHDARVVLLARTLALQTAAQAAYNAAVADGRAIRAACLSRVLAILATAVDNLEDVA